MAWTTPKTWTAAETTDASELNAYVRDNLTFLHSPPSCGVARVTATSTTPIPWDTELWDTDGMFSTGASPDDIDVQTAGDYAGAAHVQDAERTLEAAAIVRESDGAQMARAYRGIGSTTIPDTMSMLGLLALAAADKIGVVLSVGSIDFGILSLHWIGP